MKNGKSIKGTTQNQQDNSYFSSFSSFFKDAPDVMQVARNFFDIMNRGTTDEQEAKCEIKVR